MIIISELNKNDYIKVLQIEKILFINPMTLAELTNFSKQDSFRICCSKLYYQITSFYFGERFFIQSFKKIIIILFKN